MNTEQAGTAHKLGNFNAFDTDFDLQIKVKGKSKSTMGYTYEAGLARTTKASRSYNRSFPSSLADMLAQPK